MARIGHEFTAQDSAGNIIPSADVEVRNRSDNSFATIYDAETGGFAITQPGFQTDSNGDYEFWVEPGRYNVTVGSGVSAKTYPINLSNVAPVYDTRQDFVDVVSDLDLLDGTIVFADGLQYRASSGATDISDLPGFVPAFVVTVKHFGATGDGTTDDATDMQAAVTYCATNYLPLYIPKGTYLMTSGLSAASPIVIYGDGRGVTNLKFNAVSAITCIDIGPSTVFGRLSSVHSLTILNAGADANYGIKTPAQADQYNTYDAKLQFWDLEIRGDTFTGGAAYYPVTDQAFLSGALFIGDCKACYVENIKINGAYDVIAAAAGQPVDEGLVLAPAVAALTVRARNLELNALHTAIDITGDAFYAISEFDLIGCQNGIAHTGGNEAQISNGVINCQDTGIYMNGGFARKITDVDVQRLSTGNPAATNDWVGIDLDGVADANIKGCKFNPGTSAFGGGFDKYGIRVANDNGPIISNCQYLSGLTYGVYLDDVDGFSVTNGLIGSSTAITYVYLATGTRYGSILGVAFTTTSVTHTMIADDGTADWFNIRHEVDNFDRLRQGLELTIASGAVTPTHSFHTVDTESDAATDDLDTITEPTNPDTDQLLLTLRAASGSRTVVLKDGTGNLRLAGDFSMDTTQDYIKLIFDQGTWRELYRANNA